MYWGQLHPLYHALTFNYHIPSVYYFDACFSWIECSLLSNKLLSPVNYIKSRAAPIFPAIILEKYDGKSKEQNKRKMGEIWKKWMLKDWNLVYLAWQKLKYSKRTAKNSIRSIYAPKKSTTEKIEIP